MADDSLINQRVAAAFLRKGGHDVTMVSDGREAVEITARQTFDLVLMDVEMPVMGGLEAAAAIREREVRTGAHLRIVALTAHTMADDRDRCLRAGMDDYLTKPVNSTLLHTAVEEALRANRAAAAESNTLHTVRG